MRPHPSNCVSGCSAHSSDPLLSLVNVDRLSLTLQGWLNAYKEGEWLPKWASPGYRGSMVSETTLLRLLRRAVNIFWPVCTTIFTPFSIRAGWHNGRCILC